MTILDIFDQIKTLDTIIITLLTVIGGLVTLLVKQVGDRKLKEKEWEHEQTKREAKKLKIELSLLDLWFKSDFNELLHEKVAEIFDRTKANRFLLLFAINGKEDFNSATVVYERTRDTRSEGAMGRYIRLPIDNYYRNMLKQVERYRYVDIHTEDLPKESILYRIYSSPEEKVTHSRIKFIKRMTIDENNDLLLYASVGTHENESFTPEEEHEMHLAVNVIRQKASNIKIE